MAFQGNAFEGQGFQEAFGEPTAAPLPEAYIPVVVYVGLFFYQALAAPVPFVEMPRAEAASTLVTYDKATPYQALAQTPFVEVAAETITVDKWLTDSPLPPRAKPRFQFVGIDPSWEGLTRPTSWLTDSPQPSRARARDQAQPTFVAPIFDNDFAPRLSWATDSPDPAPARLPQRDDAVAFVYPIAAPPEDVTVDKWLGYPPPHPRARAPQQPDPAFVVVVAAPPETITVDKWLTDSPKPAPAKARQQADPAFIAPIFDGGFAPRLAWWTESPRVPPVPPRAQAPVAATPFVVDVFNPIVWLTDSPRQRPRPPYPSSVFVVPLFFDDPLIVKWQTDSPRPDYISRVNARVRQLGSITPTNETPPAAPEGPITIDKWLTDSPRQRPSPPYPPSVSIWPPQDTPPDPIPPPVPPSGGAGGGRRHFPFPNRYDDPEFFRERPEPAQVVEQYVEGDPAQEVEVVRAPEGPTTLSELGELAKPPRPRRKAPTAPQP